VDHSYEPSVVSIQSNPPPYELYPPAKTIFGRAYNWLRQIPQWNTHQPIYLPTIHRSMTSMTSTSSSDSITCWNFYYYYIRDCFSERPRIILPTPIARHRMALILLSASAMLTFSFLLFCSVFFSPLTSYPDPVYPDKVTNSTARFLTLNIFMRPPLIKNNWSDYKDDRLAYIEKYVLPNYDIICFQEAFAFASRRKDHLISTARKLGYNYHIESPRKYPWDIGVDGGLLIISKFPIRQSNVIEYPRGQHSDWISIKGALHALIELNPSKHVHLYTTHTQASYDLNNVINQDDTAIRLSQFALLHNFIYETAHQNKQLLPSNQQAPLLTMSSPTTVKEEANSEMDNIPIMVVGDLNVDAATHPKERPITEPSRDSSPEYLKMVDVIKGMNDLTDVVYQKFGYHPVTFGDYTLDLQGHIMPAETVLTNWDQLLTVQSIDRMFWSDQNTHSMKLDQPQVEKFWVKENSLMTDEEKEQTGFTQISGR
ncbi:Endonuclease/exonuclease/phosphatase, partial [Mycotypha africana]|uniref:Endonuclease/exonuclease/phosphatase n=1 Tax=Mycotypha africana TaxID=64632 RepID=UPI0022FFD7AF